MPKPRLVPVVVVIALITTGALVNSAGSAEMNRGRPPAKGPATLAVVSLVRTTRRR